MGAKKVVNKTSAALTVLFTVRKGDTPGTEAGAMTYQVAAGQAANCIYSQNDNPYLDGVFVSANLDGGLVATQQTVQVRGGKVDNALNQNSTITVTQVGENLVNTYSNG